MSSDIVIKVEGLSKCYQIYDQPHDRLKQFIIPRLQRAVGQEPKQYFREFWALKDVSFEVKKGETVGIIGRNGSGKSTLLQLICGTLSPTLGAVTTYGRIAALLELGSGFNLEFTGRENVYLNASLLGLTKNEIDLAYDAIVGFADIGDFINQPIKTYSSGMVVRLAFAVQAQVSPNIMIVDEALAVGDAKFQAKCFERLRQLKESGTSILLVTHSGEQIVSHCTKALLVDYGRIVNVGKPRLVVNHYLDLLFGKSSNNPKEGVLKGFVNSIPVVNRLGAFLNSAADMFFSHPGYNEHEYRWGDKSATILDFYMEADGESYPVAVTSGQPIKLCIAIKFHVDVIRPIFGFTLKTKEGFTVYGANSETLDIEEIKAQGQKDSVALINVQFDCLLAAGDYFISLGVASMQAGEIVPHDRRYDSIHLQVHPTSNFFGLANLNLRPLIDKANS